MRGQSTSFCAGSILAPYDAQTPGGEARPTMNVKVTLAATNLALTLTHASSALAQYVVQIPVDSVLDGRSVSTLTGGAVVPWVAGQGVYNDGCCGAYATAAVKAKLAPNAAGLGLPDDGLFPAAAPLPAFQLHFSNAAPAMSPQTHQVHQTTGPERNDVPLVRQLGQWLLIRACFWHECRVDSARRGRPSARRSPPAGAQVGHAALAHCDHWGGSSTALPRRLRAETSTAERFRITAVRPQLLIVALEPLEARVLLLEALVGRAENLTWVIFSS